MNKANKIVRFSLTAGVACAALTTFVGLADEHDRHRTDTTESLTPQRFVHKAAVSGLKEVYLSQLALVKAADPEIKEFAQMMVADHTRSNQRLAQIAKEKGIQIPATNAFDRALGSDVGSSDLGNERSPARNRGDATDQLRPAAGDSGQLPPDALQRVRELENLSGPNFDRAYLRAMRADHDKAVRLFQQAADSIEDRELQSFARETLPVLNQHREKLNRIGDDSSSRTSDNPASRS